MEVMEEEEDAAEGRPVDAPASPQPGPSGAGRLQLSTPDSDSEEVPWADYAGESGSESTASSEEHDDDYPTRWSTLVVIPNQALDPLDQHHLLGPPMTSTPRNPQLTLSPACPAQKLT